MTIAPDPLAPPDDPLQKPFTADQLADLSLTHPGYLAMFHEVLTGFRRRRTRPS